MISSTRDYSKFKLMNINRTISQPALERLRKSIMAKNLLKYRPILVNDRMEVIDGQHRLEAAKQLDLEIWYQIDENSKAEDIYLLNANQAKWNADDFLKYYANGGNQEYIQLRTFMEKNGMTLRDSLILLSGGGKSGGKSYELFNKGLFKFPDLANLEEVSKNLDRIKVFIDFVCLKTPEYKHALNTGSLKKALIYFFNIKDVDFDLFMKKLEYKLGIFKRCSRVADYLKIFESIYNWKNTSPVSVEGIV